MQTKTTRNQIEGILRNRFAARPTAIQDALGDEGIEVELDEILGHIEEIHKGLSEEYIEVEPPECRECGFNNYDNLINIPSKCPDCRSKWIEEPQFRITTES